jgi:putative ABC transport system permease protein
MVSMLGVLIFFAGAIAFGSVLNANIVEINDHTRVIATFRVLGYTPGAIFRRQVFFLSVVGLALSIPVGFGLAQIAANLYNNDLIRMPIVLRPTSAAISVGAVALFVIVAERFGRRAVERLDWVEGIKIREIG